MCSAPFETSGLHNRGYKITIPPEVMMVVSIVESRRGENVEGLVEVEGKVDLYYRNN